MECFGTMLISLSLVFMILFSYYESSNNSVVKNIPEFIKATVSLYGAQTIDIKSNIFKNSKTINKYLVVGAPIVKVQNNDLSDWAKLFVKGDQNYSMEYQWRLIPKFLDESYHLNDWSSL